MSELKQHLNKGISYQRFYEEQENFAKEGRTSGTEQLDSLIQYSKLNAQRMKKWQKRYQPSKEIVQQAKSIDRSENWLFITETWCGDAAQVMPQIAKIASQNEKIQLEVFYRDENLDLMDQFLTNGGRSIPKLIRVDRETGALINHWGPRTKEATEIVARNKEQGQSYDKELHLWYAKNINEKLEGELHQLLETK